MPRIRQFPHDDGADVGAAETGTEPETGSFEPALAVSGDFDDGADDLPDPATLSARVADALKGNGSTSAATLLALWRECCTAKATAENDLAVSEALSIDPENAAPEAASAAAVAARLQVRRHDAAAERLGELYNEALAAERLEHWRQTFAEPARAARDAAAAELVPAYTAALAILLPVLERARIADAMIAVANAQLFQERFYEQALQSTEVYARQLPSKPGPLNWGLEQSSVMKVKLPAVSMGYHTTDVYWPRSRPPELPEAFRPQGVSVVTAEPSNQAPVLALPADGEPWFAFQRRTEAERQHELIQRDWARRAEGDARRAAEQQAADLAAQEEARQRNLAHGWGP